MARFDNIGLFWEDLPTSRKGGKRELGPIPPIPETGWKPISPSELPDLRNQKVISFDVETWDPELNEAGPGWARGKGHICGMSVAVPGKSWYFPMRHTIESHLNMDPELILRWAKYTLETPKIPKVGANLIYDIGWLREEGVFVKGQLYDVQFAEALLDEKSKVGLEELGVKYTGRGKETDLLKDWCINYYGGAKTKWRANIYRAPVSLVGAYGEMDAELPLTVVQHQWPHIRAQGQEKLFEMECGLIQLLVDMRFAGVNIDIPYVEELYDRFGKEEASYDKQINSAAGFEVNTNAGASLAQAFDKLGIPYNYTKPTKANPDGQPSFTKDFLEGHKHPFPQLITKKRGLAKLRGTFLKSYLLDSHVNGKVYGSFHPLSGTEGGAKTGRFSSSTPNLQNIPTRTEEGKLIRKAFILDKGMKQWRKYDYSQIEYRILAHYAVGEGSDLIRQKYLDDPRTDYHASTADLIFDMTGVRLPRGQTKGINFGLAYGMGIPLLASELGITIAEAKELSAAYHLGVPFAQETMDMLSDFTNEHGFNETILGRRTRFDLWEPAGYMRGKAYNYQDALMAYGTNIQRAYLYRTLNYKLQGSSADMMKKAMYECYNSGLFDVTGCPRLTVHDELDFNDDGSALMDEAFKEIHNIMETCVPLRVPVICDLEIGSNWGNVK